MLDPKLQALHKKMNEYHAKDELLKMADVLKEAISISVDVYGINHDETLMLYTEYGGVLRNLGRYDEAIVILQKAIQISRTLRGTNQIGRAHV